LTSFIKNKIYIGKSNGFCWYYRRMPICYSSGVTALIHFCIAHSGRHSQWGRRFIITFCGNAKLDSKYSANLLKIVLLQVYSHLTSVHAAGACVLSLVCKLEDG